MGLGRDLREHGSKDRRRDSPGQRGAQMSYKKALKKLENLAVGERQLAAGKYVWEVKKGKSHCGCAIGKLLTERQRTRLFETEANNGGVPDLREEFLGIKYNPGL